MGARSNFKDEKPPSHKELGTVSFVLAALKQHEKELDRLVTKLSEVTMQLRENDKAILKVDELDKKIENLRSEISNVTKCRPITK